MRDLTPKEIVKELDRYIIGQDDAKKAVAVAIRNRWRRQRLPEDMRNEVGPKNIIMVGPTGVGKTEIARRLANLVNAPFIKVEASKYTEVGYHGRDVESMVRDLFDRAIHMVREEQTEVVRAEAERQTEECLLDALMPPTEYDRNLPADEDTDVAERRRRNREKFRQKLRDGELDDSEIDTALEQKAAPVGMFAAIGTEQLDPELQNLFERIMPSQTKSRRMPIRVARKLIFQQECEKLIDREKVTEMAIKRTENSGIIFLDELDKICGRDAKYGPDVSREGVQRDLLPIVEGSTVATRYGPVKTDHVLFIAAGAFNMSKPSDMMPELQGRFPIRVELGDLDRDDFIQILTQPENALTKQHIALLGTEGVKLRFTESAVHEMAGMAYQINQRSQNIGARRLYTIMEKLLEDISFDAPDRSGESIEIDDAFVRETLSKISQDEDLSKFIL